MGAGNGVAVETGAAALAGDETATFCGSEIGAALFGVDVMVGVVEDIGKLNPPMRLGRAGAIVLVGVGGVTVMLVGSGTLRVVLELSDDGGVLSGVDETATGAFGVIDVDSGSPKLIVRATGSVPDVPDVAGVMTALVATNVDGGIVFVDNIGPEFDTIGEIAGVSVVFASFCPLWASVSSTSSSSLSFVIPVKALSIIISLLLSDASFLPFGNWKTFSIFAFGFTKSLRIFDSSSESSPSLNGTMVL